MGYTNGAEPEKPLAPKTVKIASWLVYLTVLIGIISNLMQVLNPTMVAEQAGLNDAALSDSGLSASEVDKFFQIGMWVGVIMAFCYYALLVLFAVFMVKGANWARIVLTILCGFEAFSILSIPFALLLETPMSLAILSTVSGAVSIAIIVLIFLRPSNTFFRKMRERKQWLAFNQYR
ncbi:hypothetical protein [uncultured Rothia sp.]|uniref:hypothetical protein n=1 Tax=uncultured Rothia sp. TaxID=316088 RepID=UPI003216D0BD